MSWYWILLIIIGGLLLMGPIMLGSAKLNKVNPFILEEDNPEKDSNSFIIVNIFYPLFIPLWIEKKIFDWIKTKFRKNI